MTVLQQVVTWVIVFLLGTGFLAALYMVFVVHHVPGKAGPMFGKAGSVPMDFFLRRRLYAIEAWITLGFLSVFLALTLLRPS